MNMQARPLYETEVDRKNETRIAAVLARVWQRTLKKNPRFYPIDYSVLLDGDVRALIEIKHRPGLRYGFGDGYYLSAQKVGAGKMLTYATGCPCLLAVEFSDGALWWLDFDHLQYPPRAKWHGRDDRGDPQDFEPCVVFPWPLFKRIET